MQRSTGRVALLMNATVDHTGTHKANSRQLKAFLELEGYQVDVYSIQSQSDLAKFVEAIHKTRYEFVHCEQGHFLGLSLNDENLFEKLQIPVFSQLRDHWFYPWVWKNLKALPAQATIFHTSELILGIKDRLSGTHHHTMHTSQLAKQRVNMDAALPLRIFYSGSCRSVEDARAGVEGLVEQKLIDRILEETIDAIEIPRWMWGLTLSTDDEVELNGWTLSLVAHYRLFELARTRVRANILDVLSQFQATMFVKGGWVPPKNAVSKFSKEPISFEHSNYLSSRADYVFSDQATFREEVGERVVTALDAGQRVIARQNDFLERDTFYGQADSLYLYGTISDLKDTLSLVYENGSTVVKPGKQRPLNFSIQDYVASMIKKSSSR